ncbi:MAG: DUF3990 domain-containing protein [Treponema sp.]|nr:DUF3990 domain-containing protein [Treponema sp.]
MIKKTVTKKDFVQFEFAFRILWNLIPKFMESDSRFVKFDRESRKELSSLNAQVNLNILGNMELYHGSGEIVEGPMADDTIWNFVNDFIAGTIPRKVFWELAEFKHPTHQMSFHTIRALGCLNYLRSEKVNDGKTGR